MDRRIFITSALAVGCSSVLFAGCANAAEKIFTGLVPGVGIGGYDAVAYFTTDMPIVGDEAFATNHLGVSWRFSSQENLELFLTDPNKYVPQFGGYCAYAASKGALAKGDPEAWTIYEDKLYLNFSKSVRELWKKDIPGNIEKANAKFPKLLETWPDVTSW